MCVTHKQPGNACAVCVQQCGGNRAYAGMRGHLFSLPFHLLFICPLLLMLPERVYLAIILPPFTIAICLDVAQDVAAMRARAVVQHAPTSLLIKMAMQ